MTLADDLRPLLHSLRAIPGSLGLRPYSVKVITGNWSGDYVGHGGKWETEVSILEGDSQNPKVRFLNEEQRALGNLNHGACAVGPITPFGVAATLLERLFQVFAHQTVHIKLTGPAYPDGALFSVKEIKTDRAMHWMLTCEPKQAGM